MSVDSGLALIIVNRRTAWCSAALTPNLRISSKTSWSEKNFVLFNTKFQETEVVFYFGQASSVDAVRRLVERFEVGLRTGG